MLEPLVKISTVCVCVIANAVHSTSSSHHLSFYQLPNLVSFAPCKFLSSCHTSASTAFLLGCNNSFCQTGFFSSSLHLFNPLSPGLSEWYQWKTNLSFLPLFWTCCRTSYCRDIIKYLNGAYRISVFLLLSAFLIYASATPHPLLAQA